MVTYIGQKTLLLFWKNVHRKEEIERRRRILQIAYICSGDLVLAGLDRVVGGGRLVCVFRSSGHGGKLGWTSMFRPVEWLF